MKLKITPTDIAGVSTVETVVLHDSRGAFMRLFCELKLAELLGDRRVVQINHSRTSLVGAIRGLHYQHVPYAEMKMVRCLKGKVWDVVVDLRRDSSTFLQWHAVELSSDNALMLVIPEGCAHGYQVLEADSELLYLHTAAYTPEAERAVRYNDPVIAIDWPLSVSDLSKRDREHPLLDRNFEGVNI